MRTMPLSSDVMSVMQPLSTFTSSRVRRPLAIAPRIVRQSSHSFLVSPLESAATMRSWRLATADCSDRTSEERSAVYTIMTPFLSATTCDFALSARTSFSQPSQSAHVEQSCAAALACAEHSLPPAVAPLADALFMPQWSPDEAAATFTPELFEP